MIVAVTGASGYVGRFIIAALQQQGVEIRAWQRAGTVPVGFSGSIHWLRGDLRSPEAMRELVSGADAVVHAAFEHQPGRYRGGEGNDLDAFLAANLNGTLKLLEVAHLAEVKRFVFLSSRAVFGKDNVQPVVNAKINAEVDTEIDEEQQAYPDSHYGAYKAAVEAFLSSWSAQGMTCCSLRATGVYGLSVPEERSKWLALIQGVLRGEQCAPRGGTEVHGQDVAQAVWLLLTEPAAAGIYHCSDLYLTSRDLVRMVHQLRETTGALPPEPAQRPSNIMDCQKLRRLGWQPGGLSLLESTLGQLVEMVMRNNEDYEWQ
jgi:nucleoside-diphosphate-sugar epimerase